MVNRRSFLMLLAAPVGAWLLGACSGAESEPVPAAPAEPAPSPPSTAPSPPASGDDAIAIANVERVAAAPADATPAVLSINGVGNDLYAALTEGNEDNLVISPASILLALAMARAGAAGTTASEMDAVLHLDDPEGIHHALNGLTRVLEERSGTVDVNGEPAELELSIANAVWGQATLTWQQDFLDLLAREYGAGVRLADFAADPEAARVAVNDWVEEETHGRIPDLLAPGMVDVLTRMILVNAIYLKAPWTIPFEPTATQPAPFTLLDGSTANVPFMSRSDESMAYARGGGWQAVELPYAGDKLAMLVLVPDEGGLAAVEDELTRGLLDRAVGALAPANVVLQLPKWDIETRVELSQVLAALGMPTAFTDDADFTGMTTDEPLHISFVVHQANITVDEAGTEAAAATAVGVATTAAPAEEPIPVTVDRPFAYALRDRETGAILFLGRVTSPAA
jgi:serpin B